MSNINLYQPIHATTGPAPLVLRVVVPSNNQMIVGGVPASSTKVENYVLLSALPEDLRRRVELTIQMLVTGG